MEIEEIRDILRFARSSYSKENYPLDLKTLYTEDSNYGDFYRILLDTQIRKDEEVADRVFGIPQPDTRYMFLKSNFTARALNTIAVLDLSGEDIPDYSRAISKAYKHLFIVSTLLRLGSRRAAISLAKKTLRLAQRYEFHHVSIELLEQLRTNSLHQGKTTEYEITVKKLNRELAILESESKVKTLEERLLIHSARSLYIDESLQEQAHKALVGMETELAKHDTYMIHMAYYRMQYIYFQVIGNPLQSVEACDNAIT